MDILSIGYYSLFVTTFLAATILPFSSEIVFSAMILENFNPYSCLVIATLGNSLGGITNFFIGKIGNEKWLSKFGYKKDVFTKHQKYMHKYGYWLALFSWIPVIGDPLIISLGLYRLKFFPISILLIIGKFLRYYIILLMLK